jgi:hypothetical protein
LQEEAAAETLTAVHLEVEMDKLVLVVKEANKTLLLLAVEAEDQAEAVLVH